MGKRHKKTKAKTNILFKKGKKEIQTGIVTILIVALFAIIFVIIPSIVVQKEPCSWDFESSLGCATVLLASSTIGLVLLTFVGVPLVVFGVVSITHGVLTRKKINNK